MKKVISILLAFCLIVTAVPFVFAEGGDIMIDGSWSILAPQNCTEQENLCVETLSSKFAEVLGVNLPVVQSADGNFIAVDAFDGADVSELAAESYRIKADGNKVYINGTGIRGTLCGVYRFLEDFCSMKVYTSKLTVLPDAAFISVSSDTDIVYEPYFEYTETDWRSPHDPQYSLANGLNGGSYRSLTKAQGGTVNYLGGLCHTLTGTFCNADKYFADHPEYFALRKGERIPRQLCLTNPEVLEIVKQEVLDILARQHDPSASLQIVSLTQADNQDYCQCANCKAFEAAHGGVQSATMINFVNQVADVVKEAGYDNVAIDTFAYQYTRKAPTGIAPRDNMIVRLCTIECCFSHALDDSSCSKNKDLMKDLADWSKICNRIYVWDYTTNYAHTCCLFPDFDVIQKNIQTFYEHNVRGVYEEGNYYIDGCDTEFGELRAYMIAKCLQDPYCDIKEEVNGFLEAYYGPGGKYIGEFLDMCCEHAGNASGHLTIYQDSAKNITLNDFLVGKGDGLWERANALAETDEQLANVKRSEISWRYWKASAKKGEFSLFNPDRFDEKVQLFEDIKAAGTMRLSEGQEYGDYLDCASVKFAIPDEWQMFEADESGTKAINFFGSILEFLIPVLTLFGAFYKLAQQITSSH